MRIGVAGCGQMGRPMAEALAAAGLDVTGLDLRPPQSYGDFAPRMSDDPAAFAKGLNVLITVVRDIPQTESLLFDTEHGLIARAAELHTLVISSTLSPRWLTSLPARLPQRITLIDAPMSGAPVAAKERRLSFMLGGPNETLDRLSPLFSAMGTRHHRLGPLGAGMTAKVLNNMVAASSTAATRQALLWAETLGLPGDALLKVLHDSSGQTWFGSNFGVIEFADAGCDPTNSLGILKKDVESCFDAIGPGREAGLPAAILEAVAALKPRA